MVGGLGPGPPALPPKSGPGGPDLWAGGEVHAESLVHFLGLHE